MIRKFYFVCIEENTKSVHEFLIMSKIAFKELNVSVLGCEIFNLNYVIGNMYNVFTSISNLLVYMNRYNSINTHVENLPLMII